MSEKRTEQSSGSPGAVEASGALPFYEIQAIGKPLGAALMALGVGGMACATILWPRSVGASAALGSIPSQRQGSVRLLFGLAAVASAIAGLVLRRRRYFKDPSAVAEYVAQFKTRRLAKSLQDFGWDGLANFVTEEAVRVKVAGDIGSTSLGLDLVWQELGSAHLRTMLQRNLIDRQTLVDKFQLDVQVLAKGGDAERPLIVRYELYADFLLDSLLLQPSSLNQILLADVQTQGMNFSTLIHHNARDLWKKQLLPLEFLHDKFVALVQAEQLTYRQIHTKFCPWLLDDAIVLPEELKDMFRQELVRVSFEEVREWYWDFPIAKYGDRMGLSRDDLIQLRQLVGEYDSHKATHQAALALANDRLLQTSQGAQKVYDDEVKVQLQQVEQERKSVKAQGQAQSSSAALQAAESQLHLTQASAESRRKASVDSAQAQHAQATAQANSTWKSQTTQLNDRWTNFQLGIKQTAPSGVWAGLNLVLNFASTTINNAFTNTTVTNNNNTTVNNSSTNLQAPAGL